MSCDLLRKSYDVLMGEKPHNFTLEQACIQISEIW
jgi:hypothetical protein